MMKQARAPAVAGRFYPEEPGELRQLVDRLLARSRSDQDDLVEPASFPKALIVPHAGLRYSGAIAAAAYARLAPIASRLRRVVLLGPSHRVPVRGLALPSWGAFDTPLGRVQLDRDNIERLGALDQCVTADEPHAAEHSLEVQIPFLQRLLPEFQLTPVAVGLANTEQIARALAQVWGGPETLVLISSDLSHYHPYRDAQQFDEKSSRDIMSLATGRIRSREACGWRGVNGMLHFARHNHLIPTTLGLLNSGDTTGGHQRVVGYGAWAFGNDPLDACMPPTRTDEDTLLDLARNAIARAATGRPLPTVSVGTFSPALRSPGAAFVTLTRHGRLRGCLGTLKAFRPLAMDVVERAYATAARDPRFKPVQRDELAGLELEVALLTPPVSLVFRSAQELLDQLVPGEDGLIIEDQGHRATFLPKVWEEIRAPAQFLARLFRKAGLAEDHWSPGVRAWRYRTRRLRGPASTPEAR